MRIFGERPPVTPADALQATKNHGHTMDTVGRASPQFIVAKAAYGALPAAAIGGFNNLPGGEMLLTMPVYAAIGGVVAAGIGLHRERRKESGRLQRAEFRQDLLRSQFYQPLDVYSSPNVERKYTRYTAGSQQSYMRWYGFDRGYHGEGFDPRLAVEEFARLVAFSTEHKVDTVAVSSSILEFSEKKAKAYGWTAEGPTYKHLHAIDRFSDDELLVMKPQYAANLVSELREKQRVDNIAMLMERLEAFQPHHPLLAAYHRNDNTPEGKWQLEQLLRRRIEDKAREDSGVYIDRGKDGLGHERTRVHAHARLDGPQLFMSTESVMRDGSSRLRPDGVHTLLGKHGQQSLDALLQSIDASEISPQQLVEKIEVALWHMIGPVSARKASGYRLSRFLASAKLRPLQDAFGARLERERLQSWPHRGPYGAGVNEDTATVEYRMQDSSSRRIAAGMLLGMLSISTAYLTHGINHHANLRERTVVQALANNPRASGPIGRVQAEEALSRSGWGSLPVLGELKLSDANSAIQHRIMGAYRAADVPTAWAARLGQPKGDDTHNKVEGSDTNVFSNTGGETGFGDVSGGANNVIWHMRPYNGANTKGYWAENVDDQAFVYTGNIEAPTPPFKNANIIFNHADSDYIGNKSVFASGIITPQERQFKKLIELNDYELPVTETLELPSPAGHMVYDKQGYRGVLPAGDYRTFPIPVLQGYSVEAAAAASYINEGGKAVGLRNVPTYLVPNAEGTMSLLVDMAVAPQTADTLTVQYWVSRSQRPPRVHAAHPFYIFGAPGAKPLYKTITPREALAIWHKLPGKGGSAPPRDAYASAAGVSASHHYSFTPLEDGGVSANVLAGLQTPPSTILSTVALAFAADKAANCNTAALQEMVIARGLDGHGGNLNAVVGYLHTANDKALRMLDSHIWLTNERGRVIDPTPAGFAKNASVSKPHHSGVERDIVFGMLGTMGVLSAAAFSFIGFAVRREKRAREALLPEDSTSQQDLGRQAALMEAVLYSSASKFPTTDKLEERAQKIASRPLQERYRTLPAVKPKHMKKLIDDLQADAGLAAGSTDRERFLSFARNLYIFKRTIVAVPRPNAQKTNADSTSV